MKYGKKLLVCLAAVALILSAFVLSACQFVLGGPGSGSGSVSGSSGGGPGGDTPAEETEAELRQSLYDAVELDGVRGLVATLTVDQGGTAIDPSGLTDERDLNYMEATAAWNDDGVFGADAYTVSKHRQSADGPVSYLQYGGFARDVDFYGGGYNCYTVQPYDLEETEPSPETVGAVREYIAENKADIVADRSSVDWLENISFTSDQIGEERQDFLDALAVFLGAVEQLPAYFGGEVDATDTGYTLTYSLWDCADLFVENVLTGVLEAVDEDPAMTCGEFSELTEIIALTNRLFAGYSAEDMYGLLRIAIKELMMTSMGVSAEEVAKVDFDAAFPVPPSGQSAGGYLRSCVAAFPSIAEEIVTMLGNMSEDVAQDIDSLTPHMWMEGFLSGLFGIVPDEEQSLGDAFAEWYEGKKSDWESYGNDEYFVLIFNEDRTLTGLDIYISAEKASTEEEVGFTLLLDGHLDFCYEAPALFDLTGYRYYAGERVLDKTYEEEVMLYGSDLEGMSVTETFSARVSVENNGRLATVVLSDGDAVLWTEEISAADLFDQREISAEIEWQGSVFALRCSAALAVASSGDARMRSIALSFEQIESSGGVYYDPASVQVAFDSESIYDVIA